jgi:hypothetical protein
MSEIVGTFCEDCRNVFCTCEDKANRTTLIAIDNSDDVIDYLQPTMNLRWKKQTRFVNSVNVEKFNEL